MVEGSEEGEKISHIRHGGIDRGHGEFDSGRNNVHASDHGLLLDNFRTK